MKFAYTTAVIYLCLILSAVVFAQRKEIQASELQKLEKNAESLLRTSSYRLSLSMEYFDDRDKPGIITRSFLREVQPPDKWRTVEEKMVGDRRSKEENIWVDKALYERIDNGEWKKYSGGNSGGFDLEEGRITTTYRYIGKDTIDGVQTDRYEIEQHRLANKYSRSSPSGTIEVHFVRKTVEWFLPDGKLLKKQVENEFFGRRELSREISTYAYDPKDLKIEAPIK